MFPPEYREGIINDKNGAVIETKHGPAYVCGTAYGDGCYEVKVAGRCVGRAGVDAGMLSVIPLATAKKLARGKPRGVAKSLGLGRGLLRAEERANEKRQVQVRDLPR